MNSILSALSGKAGLVILAVVIVGGGAFVVPKLTGSDLESVARKHITDHHESSVIPYKDLDVQVVKNDGTRAIVKHTLSRQYQCKAYVDYKLLSMGMGGEELEILYDDKKEIFKEAGVPSFTQVEIAQLIAMGVLSKGNDFQETADVRKRWKRCVVVLEYAKASNKWAWSSGVSDYALLSPKEQEKLGYKSSMEEVQALLPSPTPTQPTAPATSIINDGSSGQPIKPGPLDHWRGKTDARYVWIVFAGLETEYGKTNHSNLKRLFDRYGEQMAWVFRHYPQETILPKERWLASVAECAAMKDNDTFWKMVDAIFQKMPNFTEAEIPSLMTEVGLENNFYDTTCKENPQINNKIQKDIGDGRMVGINGTPENVLYDMRTARVLRVPGAQPYEILERALVDFMRL